MTTKMRLDALLAERGVFASRTRAAASVLAGEVLLGDERRRADKPGQLVADDVVVAVTAEQEFVSRGGRKLANALDTFTLDVTDRHALDVGASTGGFTDCLLQRGAAHVVALDVAYGELHWRIRNDERVTVLERRNARALDPAELPYAPDLVKPQFEVGRGNVGKGGVVRDPDERRAALVGAGGAARQLGAAVLGYVSSGLPGPKGNQESFVWLAESGRSGAVEDLEAAARVVEP